MSMFGAILAGAAAGGGQALQNIGGEMVKTADASALQQQQSDLAEQKAEALARFNADLQVQQQKAKADAVNQAAQDILDQKRLDAWNASNDIDNGDGTYRAATLDDLRNGTIFQDAAGPDDMPGASIASDPSAKISDRDAAIAQLQGEAKVTGDYTKVAQMANQFEMAAAKNETMQAKIDAMQQHYADLASKYKDDNQTKLATVAMMAAVRGMNKDQTSAKVQELNKLIDMGKTQDDAIGLVFGTTKQDTAIAGKIATDVIAASGGRVGADTAMAQGRSAVSGAKPTTSNGATKPLPPLSSFITK